MFQTRECPTRVYASEGIFLSSFHPIMLSSTISLVGLVYGHRRKDKVGGNWGSRRRRYGVAASTPDRVPRCTVSEDSTRWNHTKMSNVHDDDVLKTCFGFVWMWSPKLHRLKTRRNHFTPKWQDFLLLVLYASFLISSKTNKRNIMPNVCKCLLMFR